MSKIFSSLYVSGIEQISIYFPEVNKYYFTYFYIIWVGYFKELDVTGYCSKCMYDKFTVLWTLPIFGV